MDKQIITAYESALDSIHETAVDIAAWAEAVETEDTINWGNVGDLKRVLALLTEAAALRNVIAGVGCVS